MWTYPFAGTSHKMVVLQPAVELTKGVKMNLVNWSKDDYCTPKRGAELTNSLNKLGGKKSPTVKNGRRLTS